MVTITVFPQSEINKHETLLSMLQTKMNTICTLVAGVNMQGKIFISELENHYTNFSPTIPKEIRAISFFSQQEILVVCEKELLLWNFRTNKQTKSQQSPCTNHYEAKLLVMRDCVVVQHNHEHVSVWDTATNTIKTLFKYNNQKHSPQTR
jgi:hypothetical protein